MIIWLRTKNEKLDLTIDNGKPLLILGSSQSVNSIGEKEFKKIDAKYITIGVNLWFLHNYVPKILIIEFDDTGSIPNEGYIRFINERKASYKNSIIILHDRRWSKDKIKRVRNRFDEELRLNLHFINPIVLASGSKYIFEIN